MLETEPAIPANPGGLERHLRQVCRRRAGAAERLHARLDVERAAAVNHQGQFPVVTVSFNLAPEASLGDAVNGIEGVRRTRDAAERAASFQGTAQAFRASLGNEPILILAAVITVYLVLGVLYESTSIRSRSCRRCRRPASAPCSR